MNITRISLLMIMVLCLVPCFKSAEAAGKSRSKKSQIHANADCEDIIDQMKESEKKIYSALNAMLVSNLQSDEKLVEQCRTHIELTAAAAEKLNRDPAEYLPWVEGKTILNMVFENSELPEEARSIADELGSLGIDMWVIKEGIQRRLGLLSDTGTAGIRPEEGSLAPEAPAEASAITVEGSDESEAAAQERQRTCRYYHIGDYCPACGWRKGDAPRGVRSATADRIISEIRSNFSGGDRQTGISVTQSGPGFTTQTNADGSYISQTISSNVNGNRISITRSSSGCTSQVTADGQSISQIVTSATDNDNQVGREPTTQVKTEPAISKVDKTPRTSAIPLEGFTSDQAVRISSFLGTLPKSFTQYIDKVICDGRQSPGLYTPGDLRQPSTVFLPKWALNDSNQLLPLGFLVHELTHSVLNRDPALKAAIRSKLGMDDEAFCELVANYVVLGQRLKKASPGPYAFVKENIMSEQEF